MAIIDEIKESFKEGSSLTKLIYVNLAVFVIAKIISVFFILFNIDFGLVQWLALPADFSRLASRPWTIITYMFYHESFLHILFNLLWLYWFGRIFLRYLDQKRLLNVYILGGICGGVLYMLAYNAFPAFKPSVPVSVALGASAGVIAVVVAISYYVPNFILNLMFIGPVKLKYIALVTILLDIMGIGGGNAGGHIAHLGGALFGYLFTVQYKNGKELGRGFGKFLDSIFTFFKPRKRMKVTYKKPTDDFEYNSQKVENQKEIDRILDKIAQSGYKSLTKAEKEQLFKMGNN